MRRSYYGDLCGQSSATSIANRQCKAKLGRGEWTSSFSLSVSFSELQVDCLNHESPEESFLIKAV